MNVTEDTEVGTELVTVTASDGDIEENAVLMYSVKLGGSGGSVVSVDGETGEVELGEMLDYETNSRLDIQVRQRRDCLVELRPESSSLAGVGY